ncbi:hypothetical protein FOA52_006256 [Chlamydomonas sp. UWO 241]|nr:hypothetical protein FOA52_006256 [Chlamydomonas sp. UWO 241]
MEAYDLNTSLVVNWAVMLPRSVIQLALVSRREDLCLATVGVFPLLQTCTLSAVRVAVARYSACMQPLQWQRAALQTPWAAPTRARDDASADHAARASGGGATHLQGAGGATEQEQRALVEEVLLEEMLQEVDQAPEGMRTPCCILDNNVLDSTSDMWQLGSDDDDEAQPEQASLHIETGQHTTVTLPSMEGVLLLAATTPLQALAPHNSGHSRVHMQFATPLLARALGRNPELVVSFALAGDAGTPAPLASLLRAHVGDLQVAARARGNPPGLMDVDIIMDMDVGLAGAARKYGGMLIAQLVDGPTMLAAVLVQLLPCAARPAVSELSWLGLDVRTASHIARDLGLLLLAPHPTGEPPHARHALMRDAKMQLTQWARHAHHHLPATLALLDSVVAQMTAADASPPPPPQMPGTSPVGTAVLGSAGREASGSASVANLISPYAGAVAHSGPMTVWCWVNVLFALLSVARSALENGPGQRPYNAP